MLFLCLTGASANGELVFSIEIKPAAVQPLCRLAHLEHGILVLMIYHNSGLV